MKQSIPVISEDSFLKWFAFRAGQKFIKEGDFRDKVDCMFNALGDDNKYEMNPENRLYIMCWVEREIQSNKTWNPI